MYTQSLGFFIFQKVSKVQAEECLLLSGLKEECSREEEAKGKRQRGKGEGEKVQAAGREEGEDQEVQVEG